LFLEGLAIPEKRVPFRCAQLGPRRGFLSNVFRYDPKMIFDDPLQTGSYVNLDASIAQFGRVDGEFRKCLEFLRFLKFDTIPGMLYQTPIAA
jgi:hypothetical protein